MVMHGKGVWEAYGGICECTEVFGGGGCMEERMGGIWGYGWHMVMYGEGGAWLTYFSIET